MQPFKSKDFHTENSDLTTITRTGRPQAGNAEPEPPLSDDFRAGVAETSAESASQAPASPAAPEINPATAGDYVSWKAK